jgi:hypothetical protein
VPIVSCSGASKEWRHWQLAGAGLEFDTTSAGALAASLRALKGDSCNAATAEILQLLFTKPMQVCALPRALSSCHTGCGLTSLGAHTVEGGPHSVASALVPAVHWQSQWLQQTLLAQLSLRYLLQTYAQYIVLPAPWSHLEDPFTEGPPLSMVPAVRAAGAVLLHGARGGGAVGALRPGGAPLHPLHLPHPPVPRHRRAPPPGGGPAAEPPAANPAGAATAGAAGPSSAAAAAAGAAGIRAAGSGGGASESKGAPRPAAAAVAGAAAGDIQDRLPTPRVSTQVAPCYAATVDVPLEALLGVSSG